MERHITIPKILLLLSLLTILLVAYGEHVQAEVVKGDEATKSKTLETYSSLPIYFVANQGQTDEKIKYYAKGRDYTIFFT